MVHGFRSIRDIHAYTTFGLPGITSRSMAPTLSDRKRVLFHVRPPSDVLKTPRATDFLNMSPFDATHTVFGSLGWMATEAIWPASYKPANCQVLPASLLL
jgi:hypothetical protein